MKPTTFVLALLAFVSPAHAAPEPLNPLAKYTAMVFSHGEEYGIRPIPESLAAPQGLSIHVESVKDGGATCILINNGGKPVYYTGERESPVYQLEKPGDGGKWVKVEMRLDCGDGLTRGTLPAGHCRRLRIEARDPAVKVNVDCFTKLPEKEADLAFKETVWSKEIHIGEKKPAPATPPE